MRTQSIAYPLPATLAERRYERKRQNDIVSGDAIGMIGKMGERIRAARKAEGLNQVQLAKKAGIAQSTLSALERGENRGTRELMALANALRRRPQWLQYGTGPQMLSEGDWPFSTPRRDYEALPAKAKALIDEYIADRVELEAAHARKSPGRAA